MTHKFDEFEHFKDSRVEKIVTAIVVDQGVDDGGEEVALDDVAVVELVLQRDDLPHEPKGVWNKRNS